MRIRKVMIIFLTTVVFTSSCDGYKYRGLNGDAVYERASKMKFEDAYHFYLETYGNTSPPMLDAARAFSVHGDAARTFIIMRSVETKDEMELSADIDALILLNYKVNPNDCGKIYKNANNVRYEGNGVSIICK